MIQTVVETLAEFAQAFLDGKAENVVTVWVEDVLRMQVVQQPPGDGGFVSSQDGVVTEFQSPKGIGAVGLLAHNNLAGAVFDRIQVGMFVKIVRGDGQVETFRVTGIERYQALDPGSTTSYFLDLNVDDPNVVWSASDLYKRVYGVPGRVTFQTCIEKDGDWSWGRLFIIAERVEEPPPPPTPEPTWTPAPIVQTGVALLSHYTPWTGGTNCSRFVGGRCISRTASGERWEDWLENGLACPREFPFYTRFLVLGKVWTCVDRGGAIRTLPDGSFWLDLLTGSPPVPFGTRVTVEIYPP